jgi:hypothetical protein
MSQKRREQIRSGQPEWNLNLEVVHPNAAGIDIGNESHYVAVAPDRDPNPVRQFACFTEDLHRLADWAEKLWHRYGGDAVYRSVLVAGLRDPDGEGARGVSGICTAYQESAWTEDRRAGMPVAAATAHLRLAE